MLQQHHCHTSTQSVSCFFLSFQCSSSNHLGHVHQLGTTVGYLALPTRSPPTFCTRRVVVCHVQPSTVSTLCFLSLVSLSVLLGLSHTSACSIHGLLRFLVSEIQAHSWRDYVEITVWLLSHIDLGQGKPIYLAHLPCLCLLVFFS